MSIKLSSKMSQQALKIVSLFFNYRNHSTKCMKTDLVEDFDNMCNISRPISP